jgi:hypothetical protein
MAWLFKWLQRFAIGYGLKVFLLCHGCFYAMQPLFVLSEKSDEIGESDQL